MARALSLPPVVPGGQAGHAAPGQVLYTKDYGVMVNIKTCSFNRLARGITYLLQKIIGNHAFEMWFLEFVPKMLRSRSTITQGCVA